MAEVTLEMLRVLIQRGLDEQASQRRETADLRTLVLALVDQGRRTERRVAELPDNIGLMVKAELMGRLGHFETRIDHRLGQFETQIEERIEALRARVAWAQHAFGFAEAAPPCPQIETEAEFMRLAPYIEGAQCEAPILR